MRQITIDKKKNTAAVNVNSFFYPLHLLQFAKAEYAGIAKISISQGKGRALVEISPKEKRAAEETALQFCNFVLSLKREFGDHA